ncbi:MAG: tryptophan 2,3-dioxygenase family protein [Bacteroidota bacterium]|nr:tryptophan 2,3-dioxygenase family protein [Bacteroidota bacterium]MDP4214886.1 tryptophan 2,3-dioxygenase family protein [Bacteroidota bacterium]MDP4244748.1 tryptophan 2,3-dioxygenase family protein [Bacteroidota bacterium]MDP4252392.1 tryptophan 2,3-dioxygenase family protein [Bacteroidota bacterium]MDP4257949.1 tryptophan 2,3-dioxygenase family protein [Bacteroidota bacterium]
MPKEVHYSDYLQLDKILSAQRPESAELGLAAHDETLFIVIHQTYELWFKQLLVETGSVIDIMQSPALDDNSPELQTVVHRLGRCATILKVLVHQIDIMETMTPMDFLDFRDMLRPASGFQSWQFKLLEARLGLKYEHRYGQEYYISQLRQPEINRIKTAEKEKSLLQLLNEWLERMPFFNESTNWEHFVNKGPDPFWSEYRLRYQESLADREKDNLSLFDAVFYPEGSGQPVPAGEDKPRTTRSLSPAACRSALFIMLYRGYPILQLPFQLLHQLLEIDEQLSTWRYRHMSMVHRMIGTRIGTGGSTGKDYLKAALESHHLFKEIAGLTSFLIERRRLPPLSPEMEKRLGFIA